MVTGLMIMITVPLLGVYATGPCASSSTEYFSGLIAGGLILVFLALIAIKLGD
jgi:hypothetical protein